MIARKVVVLVCRRLFFLGLTVGGRRSGQQACSQRTFSNEVATSCIICHLRSPAGIPAANDIRPTRLVQPCWARSTSSFQQLSYFEQQLAFAVPQHAPSGQQSPPGQHDLALAAVAVPQHAPSGQQSPPGQHELAAAQQAPSGQQSPPGQHDSVLVTVLALAATQHGPSGQQSPPGQHVSALVAVGLAEPE
jgi:hypothetical protein